MSMDAADDVERSATLGNVRVAAYMNASGDNYGEITVRDAVRGGTDAVIHAWPSRQQRGTVIVDVFPHDGAEVVVMVYGAEVYRGTGEVPE